MASSALFAREDPPPRIMGIEAEHDIRTPDGKYPQDWAEDILSLQTLEAAGFQNTYLDNPNADLKVPYPTEAWLPNGARMYQDGDNLEWCTPESLGASSAVAALWASAIAVRELVKAAQEDYRVDLRPANINPKNGHMLTKGLHTNLAIPDLHHTARTLGDIEMLWATQIYAWGGAVVKDGFSISPKGLHMGQSILINSKDDAATVRGKPFGRVTSDHGKKDSFSNTYRLEGRTSTPSSPYSTWMGLNTTSLLLRIKEHPRLLAKENERLMQLRLGPSRSVARLIERVVQDFDMQETYTLLGGQEYRAIDIQRSMAELSVIACEKLQLPQEEQDAAAEWVQVCDDLDTVRRGDAGLGLIGRIGWAAKYQHLINKVGKQEIWETDIQKKIGALRVCSAWDAIAPTVGHGWRQLSTQEKWVSRQAVKNLVYNPPQDTRALVRAECLRAGDVTGLSWHQIDRSGQPPLVLDPDQTTIEHSSF